MANSNQLDGIFNEAAGKVQDAVGDLTGELTIPTPKPPVGPRLLPAAASKCTMAVRQLIQIRGCPAC
ncbi:CsbD family protein [Paraburkholderia panacisoli]|uniref:CsbD family protein n=1 Tax=Paraburkholderia panacisoli TaxID=2603818 RepID=A0A5B0HEG8_9BURK|nr:CsbD family protein [Paraburkholderia panacisoli]KAA1013527.1 CsbD family protein [Paraburkholderia panacisoli]